MRPALAPARPIPWRTIVIALAKRYGWGPETIGNLTLAQVWLFWREPVDRGHTVSLPPSESRAIVAAHAEQRSAWVDEQLRLMKCARAG